MAFQGFNFNKMGNMFQQAQVQRSNFAETARPTARGPSNTGVVLGGGGELANAGPAIPIQAEQGSAASQAQGAFRQRTDAMNKPAPNVAPVAPTLPGEVQNRGNGCTQHAR